MGEREWEPHLPPCYGFPFGCARGDCWRRKNREACRGAAEAMAADLARSYARMALVSKIRER